MTRRRRREHARPDAVAAARAVVGLYGDPTVSWSILLDARLTVPVDPADVTRRLGALTSAHPALGRPPVVEPSDDLGRTMSTFADTTYGPRAPLLRAAMDASRSRLVLAAHHGCVDGLGLLAVLAHALDVPVSASARGVAGTPAGSSFASRAPQRLAEALLRPPARFARTVEKQDRGAAGDRPTGDWMVAGPVEAPRLSTGAMVAMTRRALESWNGPGAAKRAVIAVGASRRPTGAPLRPDRCTAYLRLAAGEAVTVDAATELLRRTPPEPDFPASEGWGLGPLVTRLLASRLGATALVSNLGVVSAGGVAEVDFYPVASGPSGVACGLVTIDGRSRLTLRARRADFDEAAATRLWHALASELIG